MFAEIRTKYLREPLTLPFVVHTVGEMRFQAAIERPSGLDAHQTLIVTKGEGVFTIGDRSFPLAAGEGVFIRKNVPHSYRSAGKEFSTLWVSFLGAESVLDHYKLNNYFCFDTPPMLPEVTRALWQECCGSSTLLSRSAAGYAWLAQWLHDCFALSAPVAVQVRRYLESHFAEPITLDQVADAVHMSRYALCHYYKESCGTTVMEELRQIRIAKATRLLQFSTASIEEVSSSCGFESPSYFSKLFKLATGYTPREYRLQHQK